MGFITPIFTIIGLLTLFSSEPICCSVNNRPHALQWFCNVKSFIDFKICASSQEYLLEEMFRSYDVLDRGLRDQMLPPGWGGDGLGGGGKLAGSPL